MFGHPVGALVDRRQQTAGVAGFVPPTVERRRRLLSSLPF